MNDIQHILIAGTGEQISVSRSIAVVALQQLLSDNIVSKSALFAAVDVARADRKRYRIQELYNRALDKVSGIDESRDDLSDAEKALLYDRNKLGAKLKVAKSYLTDCKFALLDTKEQN